MGLGLAAVVVQVKAIVQNKNDTIKQLQTLLSTATANAIDPSDQQALADLQALVASENGSTTTP